MYHAAVIDTDSDFLKYMSGLLENNCYIISVSCFNQWSDYLSELKKGSIDLALIRVDSPGLQGLSLARVTQRLSPATRIVFISSAASYAVMAFEERARGYLVLPIKQQDLDEVVDNIRRRDNQRWGDLSK